jgi:tetratricopeptide (TPR) repeat protein
MTAALLENIASMVLVQADPERALELANEALAIYRETGATYSVPWALLRVGSAQTMLGRLAEARAAQEEAVELLRPTSDLRGLALALYRLGETLTLQGELAAARRAHEEARRIREEQGMAWYLAYSHRSLAELDLWEGRPAEAIDHAERSAAEYRRQKRPDHEADALAVLARAQLAAGRVDEAIATAKRARTLVDGTQHDELKIIVPIWVAPVIAATKRREDVAAALDSLDRAEQAAAAGEMSGLVLQARLERLRIVPDRAAARKLAADAKAAGFGLYASQARAIVPR